MKPQKKKQGEKRHRKEQKHTPQLGDILGHSAANACQYEETPETSCSPTAWETNPWKPSWRKEKGI